MPPNHFAHLERETIDLTAFHKIFVYKIITGFHMVFFNKNKYKPTNVGRIALERQARSNLIHGL